MSLNRFNAKYIVQSHRSREDAMDGAPHVEEAFAKNLADARKAMNKLAENGNYYAAFYAQDGEMVDETEDVQ